MKKNTKLETTADFLKSQSLPKTPVRMRRLSGRQGRCYSGEMSYRQLLTIVNPNDANNVVDAFGRKQRPTDATRAAQLSRTLFTSYRQGKMKSIGVIMLTAKSSDIQVQDIGGKEVDVTFNNKIDGSDGAHRITGPVVLLTQDNPQGYEDMLEDYDVPVQIIVCDSLQESQEVFIDENSGKPVPKNSKLPIIESIENGLSHRITRNHTKYNWDVILGLRARGHLMPASTFVDGTRAFEKNSECTNLAKTEIAFLKLLSKMEPFRDDNFPQGIDNHRERTVLFSAGFWVGICSVAARLFNECKHDLGIYESKLDKVFSNFKNTTLWDRASLDWQGVMFHSTGAKITGAKHFALTEQYLMYKFGIPFDNQKTLSTLKKYIKSYGHRTGDVLGQPWI